MYIYVQISELQDRLKNIITDIHDHDIGFQGEIKKDDNDCYKTDYKKKKTLKKEIKKPSEIRAK